MQIFMLEMRALKACRRDFHVFLHPSEISQPYRSHHHRRRRVSFLRRLVSQSAANNFLEPGEEWCWSLEYHALRILWSCHPHMRSYPTTSLHFRWISPSHLFVCRTRLLLPFLSPEYLPVSCAPRRPGIILDGWVATLSFLSQHYDTYLHFLPPPPPSWCLPA